MEYFIILKNKAFRYIKKNGSRLLLIFICTLLSTVLIEFAVLKAKEERLKKGISESVFRFHVIANSDSENDQQIKLKVKEEVLNYINESIKNADNLKDAEKYLKDEKENIEKVANRVLAENNFEYEAEALIVHEIFPKRTYGDITMPAGEYDAFKIVLGEGSGQNFWCVLYPPLCYVDASLCEVSEETKNDFENILSDEEYEIILNDGRLEPDFKILEVIDSVLK